MLQCHGWGSKPPWTASHINIICIQSVLAPCAPIHWYLCRWGLWCHGWMHPHPYCIYIKCLSTFIFICCGWASYGCPLTLVYVMWALAWSIHLSKIWSPPLTPHHHLWSALPLPQFYQNPNFNHILSSFPIALDHMTTLPLSTVAPIITSNHRVYQHCQHHLAVPPIHHHHHHWLIVISLL